MQFLVERWFDIGESLPNKNLPEMIHESPIRRLRRFKHKPLQRRIKCQPGLRINRSVLILNLRNLRILRISPASPAPSGIRCNCHGHPAQFRNARRQCNEDSNCGGTRRVVVARRLDQDKDFHRQAQRSGH